MKTVSFILVALFINLTYSQENISIGKVEYEMTFLLENYAAELIYNNEKAAFIYSKLVENSETTDDQGNINIKIADTVPHIIYNDLRVKKLFNYSCIFAIREHDWIEEKAINFNWILIDETKKIGDIECHKATCRFRGRNYIAWYAPEIQSYFGPWKFSGLPGLIIEAYDDENKVFFFAKKITIPFNTSIDFNPSETILLENVKQIQKEKADELIKNIESKQERGMMIKVKVNTTEQIEKE